MCFNGVLKFQKLMHAHQGHAKMAPHAHQQVRLINVPVETDAMDPTVPIALRQQRSQQPP